MTTASWAHRAPEAVDKSVADPSRPHAVHPSAPEIHKVVHLPSHRPQFVE
jgi:hypothetical protein